MNSLLKEISHNKVLIKGLAVYEKENEIKMKIIKQQRPKGIKYFFYTRRIEMIYK